MIPKSYLLEEMTWQEIQEAMDNGMKTVLIFAASTEQHGPQLAECTDTILGYGEGIELAKRLGDALVAPVIRPGLSEHHMVLPGTISLRPETFRMLVEDYVSAYVRHGFERIVLCSSHGGNFNALEEIAQDLSEKYPDRKIITGMPIADVTIMLNELDEKHNLPAGTCGGHACRWETSLMMKLRPEHVRTDRLQPGFVGKVSPEILDRFFTEGVKAVSEIGVMGDPSGSSREEGEEFFSVLMDRVEQEVRRKLGTN